MQGHLSGTRMENYSPITFLNDLFLKFLVFHKTPVLIKANDAWQAKWQLQAEQWQRAHNDPHSITQTNNELHRFLTTQFDTILH